MMDEALRRAYLAAMDIPVWIPRDADDPWDGALAEQETGPVAAGAAVGAGTAEPAREPAGRVVADGRHARAILQELGGPSPPPAARRPEPARAARPAPTRGGAGQLTLLFATAGGTLFIDDSAGERPARRDLELLAALAFVLEREKLQPEPHPFRWPPHPGRAAGEARDAVLGRIAKFADGMALRRIVLMGEGAARLLLDGAPAGARVHRLDRPACALLAIPSIAQLLADPQAKRIAWQTLRLPHG